MTHTHIENKVHGCDTNEKKTYNVLVQIHFLKNGKRLK